MHSHHLTSASKSDDRKALCLSALVFPGAGLFVLHKKNWGLTWLVATLAFLIPLLADTIIRAKTVSDQLAQKLLAEPAADIPALLAQITSLPSWIRQQLTVVEGLLSSTQQTVVYGALLALWLAGLIVTLWVTRQSRSTQPRAE